MTACLCYFTVSCNPLEPNNDKKRQTTAVLVGLGVGFTLVYTFTLKTPFTSSTLCSVNGSGQSAIAKR